MASNFDTAKEDDSSSEHSDVNYTDNSESDPEPLQDRSYSPPSWKGVSPETQFECSWDEGRNKEKRGRHRVRSRWPRVSQSEEREPDGGRLYQWQIHSGDTWQDIDNDHIIEAQYSKPNTKGINIYNTPFGTVNIDFNRMRVRKPASLRVRRLSSRQQQWTWYYCVHQRWIQYGKKDDKGKVAPVNSAQIEKEFQKQRDGSLQFAVGSRKYIIKFQEMRQENLTTRFKRKVARRPSASLILSSGFQALSLSPNARKPTWQFEGSRRNWYDFRHRSGTNTESSVSSADVEANYQQNPQGCMYFTAGGYRYKLDFSAMIQTNLTTNTKRKVRRVVP